MKAFVTKPAPDFKAQALVGTGFREVSLADYRGQYLLLFFYPLDFSFVCPTELIALQAALPDFYELNCCVAAVSVDSHLTHLAWNRTPRSEGGLGGVEFPILADLSKKVSRDYGVLVEEAGIALRGTFLIDPSGVLRYASVCDLPMGRSAAEALRMLRMHCHYTETGEVCPADWIPGDAGIVPEVEASARYFSARYKERT